MSRWLDATEAARRLGVKPATLYAYVSRGQLRRRTGPDGRRSEYHADDVADLAVRGRRARPVRPSDIVLPTAITAITPGGPTYRGESATDLAGRIRFEAVAEHLWGVTRTSLDVEVEGDAGPRGSWQVPARLRQVAPTVTTSAELGPAAQLPAIMVAARLADPLHQDLRPLAVTTAARGLIAALASVGTRCVDDQPTSIATRIVDTLLGTPGDGPSTAGSLPEELRPAAVHAVDAALTLLADHELAASTLAARVAASSRCDPYAVVLAGAAVHTGARHGAASRPMERAVRAVGEGRDPAEVLAAELTADGEVPALGHPLYPDGDPRATRLLEILRSGDLAARCGPADALLGTAAERGLRPPNIDAALAALTSAIAAPVGSGELIFAIARTAGWIAHALEQYEDPRLLRPRAVYTGA